MNSLWFALRSGRTFDQWSAMFRLTAVVTISAISMFGVGCGGEADEEQLPNASPGNIDAERVDWVVDGMECDGEEEMRLVGVVDEDGELRTEYLRGDDCIEAGTAFWDGIPEEDGDETMVTVADETQATFVAERAGDDAIRLVADDNDDLLMRRVHPQVNPSPIPDLSDFDLAGQWWMEDYPCLDEQVPQVVRIIHPGNAAHLTKILGDECIGDGENFMDAELDGTSLEGVALMEEESGLDDFDEDDEEAVWATGTVRTDDYIRLDIDNRAVSLRRVMADAEE